MQQCRELILPPGPETRTNRGGEASQLGARRKNVLPRGLDGRPRASFRRLRCCKTSGCPCIPHYWTARLRYPEQAVWAFLPYSPSLPLDHIPCDLECSALRALLLIPWGAWARPPEVWRYCLNQNEPVTDPNANHLAMKVRLRPMGAPTQQATSGPDTVTVPQRPKWRFPLQWIDRIDRLSEKIIHIFDVPPGRNAASIPLSWEFPWEAFFGRSNASRDAALPCQQSTS